MTQRVTARTAWELQANEPVHGPRLYRVQVDDGDPKAISPDLGRWLNLFAVAPDGKFAVARAADGRAYLFPADGGEPRPVPGLGEGDVPIQIGEDGKHLFVFQQGEVPARISRVDLATGRRELWRQIGFHDAAGVSGIGRAAITPDGRSYLYDYDQVLSELYVVAGLQ